MASGEVAATVLRCQTPDALGHALLGYHDGLDSWTVNVAHDPGGTHQAFVSHHEAAHHRLHAGTPWGVAVLAAGVPNRSRIVTAERWVELVSGCRIMHEVYATWSAHERTPNADELLAGNLLYTAYLRDARYLAAAISTSAPVASRGVDLLARLVMAPAALRGAGVAAIRSGSAALAGDRTPDRRLEWLIDHIDGSGLQRALQCALDVPATATLELDEVFAELARIGLESMTFAEQASWVEDIVTELELEHPGRYAVSTVRVTGDLTEWLDEQQRERIQMHDAPLPLHGLAADADGHFDAAAFARTAAGVGKHVWLAWLAPGVLRRQFTGDPVAAGGAPTLGLLSCDRVHGPPRASWFAFFDVPPGLAARAVASGDTTPLLFTTLRTLDATGDEVDFRGFAPAFVLIDSDLVGFLQRSLRDGALAWSVITSSGSRTVDVLIFEQREIPGIYYLHVCSAPTGRLTAAWLRSHDQTSDSPHFEAVRPLAWALIEHLLGTFWMFDLHGDTAASASRPPRERGQIDAS